MPTIKKIPATITAAYDLSDTARDVVLSLSEPLPFSAGSFVNVFITHEGEVLRRAFSISSDEGAQSEISLSIRLNPKGLVTPLFWQDIIGTEVEVMGPLGLNTADKMLSKRVFLFGFGIGAGVVKSLAAHFVTRTDLTTLTIMTGNRSEEELLHKDFFDTLTQTDSRVAVDYIVSKAETSSIYKKGYLQEHLSGLNFTDADVYVCGQENACNQLVDTIKQTSPTNCNFFIEGFH